MKESLNRSTRTPIRALALLLLLGTVAAGLAGCGQKGPLVPPPAATTNSQQ